LLRVLQEGTFERVGESVTRHTDVRVIAATNLKIETALKDRKTQGRFILQVKCYSCCYSSVKGKN
jgi:transcriptional regulator with GAF, ATPase, and Fis domain